MTTSVGYRADIDGLRAIAVSLVLLYHAELGVPGGYIGVDVFFVISGFLITGIIKSGLESGTFSIAEFWRRRISRIVPASTATVLACCVVGVLILVFPFELRDLASEGLAQQAFLANVYFFNRIDYFDGPSDLKPLLHMWSLAVEEQFYLAYPFATAMLFRWRRAAVPVAIIVIGAVSLGVSLYELRTSPSAAFFLLPSRSWELLLGAILHWMPSIRPDRRLLADGLAFIGLACILVPAAVYSKTTPFPGIAAVPPCVGAALMIVAGRAPTTVAGRLLSLRPFVFIGLISYSLYLVHWPLLAFLRIELGLDLPLSIRLAVVPAAVALAALSWWGIEAPLRKIGTRQPVRRVMACFALLTATMVGLLVVLRASDGPGGRLGPEAGVIVDTPSFDRTIERTAADVDADRLPLFGPCEDGVDCLVWGDSHAAAIVGAVEASARSLGCCFAVASRNETAPLLATWRRGREPATVRWNDAVVAYVRRHRIPVVVLVSRWSVNVEGVSATDLRKLIGDAEELGSDPAAAARVMARGMDRTVEALRSIGTRVVIVGQFPEHQVHPWRVMMKEIESGQRSALATSKEAHEARHRRVQEVFGRLQSLSGITVIDPAAAMFVESGGSARAIVGDEGGPFYVDTHHPSRNGAIVVLEPLLTDAVRRAINDTTK